MKKKIKKKGKKRVKKKVKKNNLMTILEITHENKSKEQLIKELRDIEERYDGLIEDLESSELKLRQKITHLGCIHDIIKLIQNPNFTVRFILGGVVKKIQENFKLSKLSGVKITFDNSTYLSENYLETPWSISEKVFVADKELKITLCYPESDKYLPEERIMLVEICKLLKGIFEFKLVWL